MNCELNTLTKLNSQIKIHHFIIFEAREIYTISNSLHGICFRYVYTLSTRFEGWKYQNYNGNYMEIKTPYTTIIIRTTTKNGLFNCMRCQLSFSKSAAKSENSIFHYHHRHRYNRHHHLYWLIQQRESIFHWLEI